MSGIVKTTSPLPGRLNALMREKDLSYRKLAKDIGVSETTVYYWINQPPLVFGRLAVLCKALDVSADYLLGLSQSRARNEEIFEEDYDLE